MKLVSKFWMIKGSPSILKLSKVLKYFPHWYKTAVFILLTPEAIAQC